ncbi:MAG: hypothetical protein QME94_19305, partial [Anaerolineae bacterium]|nr:hypothetical protein [Anaerolineae bacterium]
SGPCTDHQISIAAGAKHPAEAFKLMEFFTTDVALDTMFETVGWMTTKLPWMKSLDVSKYKGLDFFISSMTEADLLLNRTKCPMQAFVRDEAMVARDAVIYGTATPEQAVETWEASCLVELEEQKSTWVV